MKIYVDVTNTLLSASTTGIQRVTTELLTRLATSRELVLLRECPEQTNGTLCDFAVLPTEETLRAMRLPAAERPKLPLIPRSFISAEKMDRGAMFFDVDASWHNATRRSVLYPALKARNIFIAAIHYDAVPLLHPEYAHPETVRKFVPHLEAQLRYCDMMLPISNSIRDDLEALAGAKGLPTTRFQTIPLGADFSTTTSDTSTSDDISQFIQANRDSYILSVGTLEPRKNHMTLLDAFENLAEEFPKLSLAIVGRRGWNVDGLIARIENHPLRNSRLFWFEHVSDSDLKTLYSNAVLSAYPSLYEGFGLPLIESLQAGTITITSDRGALAETGGSYADYVDPTKADALANAIRTYASNTNARDERRKQLRSFSAPLWNTSSAVANNVIETALQERREEHVANQMQLVYLSINPDLLRETLVYVERLMPFVDEVIVVTPERLRSRFYYHGQLPLRVITDEELLGEELEEFTSADHTQRNWMLRRNLMQSSIVRDEFLMSDDDYRPLRPITKDFFKTNGRYQGYYFGNLANWPARGGTPNPYDLGQTNTHALLRDGEYTTLSFSAHCPQIIDKAIYLEMLQHFGEDCQNTQIDEWSIYFNYGLKHHPDRFDAVIFKTLCWPALPTDWESDLQPTEFCFENYYPHLYSEGQIFAAIPREFSEDYQLYSMEKVTRRLLAQADYDKTAALRDASLVLPTASETSQELDCDTVKLALRGLPQKLHCRAGRCTRLAIEIETTKPASEQGEILLQHDFFDEHGVAVNMHTHPVDISRYVAESATTKTEVALIAPPLPGHYSLAFNLRLNGSMPLPRSAERASIELEVN